MKLNHMRAAALILSLVAPTVADSFGGTAIPTKVLVRVLAHDAKLIGTKVGGAMITFREVATGDTLARGIHKGKTGDTRLIVVQPWERGSRILDTPGAAGYTATLMLERPTVVEIIAEGPLGAPQATQRTSTTMLLVPGQDVLGEGIVLKVHGFTVQMVAPAQDTTIAGGDSVEVRCKITMV